MEYKDIIYNKEGYIATITLNRPERMNAFTGAMINSIGQALQDANSAIVNVPTSTGGVIPVRLERQGTVWIGPRGEAYSIDVWR